jgi:hypothetical protein
LKTELQQFQVNCNEIKLQLENTHKEKDGVNVILESLPTEKEELQTKAKTFQNDRKYFNQILNQHKLFLKWKLISAILMIKMLKFNPSCKATAFNKKQNKLELKSLKEQNKKFQK